MNQPCMDQNQPCISKAPKNKHMPRVFDLKKNRFQNKKMKRFHKKNHFRLQRNGTFFLLLRRFFKLPKLEFPLHGCNLTNFFWNRTLNKKRTKPQTSKKEQKQQGRIIQRKESVPSRSRDNARFWRSAACPQAYQKFSRKKTSKKEAMWKFLWTRITNPEFSSRKNQRIRFPAVRSVPKMWAFKRALGGRNPTSSVCGRQFQYRPKKFFQFITTRQEFILGDHGIRQKCFSEDSH